MAMCVGKGMQRSLANSYTLAKSCECLTLKWAMSSRLGPGMRAFHEIIIHTISVHVQIPCHVTLLLCGSKGLTRKSLILTSKGRKHFLNALFQSHDFSSMTLFLEVTTIWANVTHLIKQHKKWRRHQFQPKVAWVASSHGFRPGHQAASIATRIATGLPWPGAAGTVDKQMI